MARQPFVAKFARMRIILTCNFSPWSAYSGGAQRSVHNIASHLVELGVDTTVVYSKPPGAKIKITETVNYNLMWAVLPAFQSKRTALLRNASSYSVKNTVLKLVGQDTVVHSNGEEASLLATMPKREFGLVSTPRYPFYPEFKVPDTSRIPGFLKLTTLNKYQALAYVVRGADVVTPTSTFAVETVKSVYGIDDSKLEVVPNGIAQAAFEAPSRKPKRGSIFFFGRLETTKGVDILLKALASLPETTSLTVAGSGLYENEFRNTVQNLGLKGRVRHVAWMNPRELAETMSESAVVCLPSLEESFGNAVAEALAAGAPLVTTDAGSIPELVQHDKTGLMAKPGDVESLSASLKTMLDDPAKAELMGQAGKASMKAYRWGDIAKRWIEVYERVLARR